MKKLIMGLFFTCFVSIECATFANADLISGDFEYTLYESGNACITGYYPYEEEPELVIPETLDGHKVVAIGVSAFAANDYLEKVTLPDTVVGILRSAFISCHQLKSINLPEGLTVIDDGAFMDDENLTEIGDFPSSLETIGDSAFQNSGITDADLSTTKLTEITSFTFEDCKNLNKVVLGDYVTCIGQGAFTRCENLKEVVLNDGLEVIEGANFDNSKLEMLEVPSTVTTIGGGFCDRCSELTLFIPDTVINMGGNESCIGVKKLYAPEGSAAAHYFKKFNINFELADSIPQ